MRCTAAVLESKEQPCSWEVPVSDPASEAYRHPVGTLAIVGIYGALFAVGWVLVYVYVYLSRGAVTP